MKNVERRSIGIETKNDDSCLVHVEFAFGFVSMAQKIYFSAFVEPEIRAVLDKHKKNLGDLAHA